MGEKWMRGIRHPFISSTNSRFPCASALFEFWCVFLFLLVAQTSSRFREFCSTKIFEYVIHSRLSGLECIWFRFFPLFFPVFFSFFILGVCFVSAGFGLGVAENNEILLFFLPSLIVKSWKSTALFSNSFPALDNASGEENKDEAEGKEEKFVLVLQILALELSRLMKSSCFSCRVWFFESCKSTALFCYSFTAIDKAIGEAAEEEEEEEEKFVLVLRVLALELTRIMKSCRFFCHLWLSRVVNRQFGFATASQRLTRQAENKRSWRRRRGRRRRKVCFCCADFRLGVVENNEILLFFLPCLIVERCKSTALFCDSYAAVDKARRRRRSNSNCRRRWAVGNRRSQSW